MLILWPTIEQVKMFTVIAVLIAIFVSILITSLFMKMLIAKDRSQIAIMKSMGFSLQDIRLQYITRALCVLCPGMLLGAICANSIGQGIVSALMSLLGASQIQFVIDPFKAYIVCPLLLVIVVAVTTVFSAMPIKKNSIVEINAG